MNVLFVCLGNTCRSPMAEGILKMKFHEKNLKGHIDSAGFEPYNINDPPNPKAVEVALKYGVDLQNKKSRLFRQEDFDRFDSIYVMDIQNMTEAKRLARNETDIKKLDFLMNLIEPGKNIPVADPYKQGFDTYEKTFLLMEEACEILINEIISSNR